MIRLGEHLSARRADGKKLLVAYVTAGAREDWHDVVAAVADAGADAIEIGIPFSDPVMDGPVIQEASLRALNAGATPRSMLESLKSVNVPVPLAVMTYYNLVFRFGFGRFAAACVDAGVSGAILPDLPLEEAGGWNAAAEAAGVDTVMLVAPNTPDERLARVCAASRGFVYAIGTLGVTGERTQLATSAALIGDRARAVSNVPVLIGVGVSTGEQAAAAVQHADGVIVGSAVVRRMLDGSAPAEIGRFVGELRSAIDNA